MNLVHTPQKYILLENLGFDWITVKFCGTKCRKMKVHTDKIHKTGNYWECEPLVFYFFLFLPIPLFQLLITGLIFYICSTSCAFQGPKCMFYIYSTSCAFEGPKCIVYNYSTSCAFQGPKCILYIYSTSCAFQGPKCIFYIYSPSCAFQGPKCIV